jgi:hypothetical protein
MIGAVPAFLFARVSVVYGSGWLKFTPAIWASLLAAVGLFLIRKRHSILSKKAKTSVAISTGLLILTPAILVIHIRDERHVLQIRAIEFLKRPVPSEVMGDADGAVGLFYVGPNEDGLKRSHALIKRYADSGRIRWSAAIQGQFAMTYLEIGSCEDAKLVKANEKARLYVADCKAILDDEWRMGFWQYVEDTIELKQTIPEIEEEDAPRHNSKTTISPNGSPSHL